MLVIVTVALEHSGLVDIVSNWNVMPDSIAAVFTRSIVTAIENRELFQNTLVDTRLQVRVMLVPGKTLTVLLNS